MLVTDDGDEKCWRQLVDVVDRLGGFRHQYTLTLNICVLHQIFEKFHLIRNFVTNTKQLSPTPKDGH